MLKPAAKHLAPQYPLSFGIPSVLEHFPGAHAHHELMLALSYPLLPHELSPPNHYSRDRLLFLQAWLTDKNSQEIWIVVQVLYQSAVCPWTHHEASVDLIRYPMIIKQVGQTRLSTSVPNQGSLGTALMDL